MDKNRATRTGVGNSVVAGSIWETRMKTDEVKGGIKVFKDEENSDELAGDDPAPPPINKRVTSAQSVRRKTWKSETFEGINKHPIQISKKNIDEQSKELSVSVDGGIFKRSPIQLKKTRSDATKELSKSVDGFEKDPILFRKIGSEPRKRIIDIGGKTPIEELKKGGLVKNLIVDPVKEIKETQVKICEKSDHLGYDDGIEKNPIDVDETRSDDKCTEVDVCEEKVITNSLINGTQIKPFSTKMLKHDDDEQMENEEIEIEKKINVPEENQLHKKPVTISPTVRKQTLPVVKRASIYQNLNKPRSNHPKPVPVKNGYEFQTNHPKTQNRLQNLVDLIMWRDVSRSAFVFGIGTFMIASSSYTSDLNISFISVISYMGLVYLALIFLYRTIISRGFVDVNKQEYVIGEEEAIWMLKLLLPYMNEFLLNMRALFSGDPTTTMKLAVVLFVLARCGGSITIWKMAKLGFFGVFIVPKVCSSYSTQLTVYGKFWVYRFKDAWKSCAHKKAVAAAIFTLVWNLSSIVARIWALFMLFVAFRCYQQSIVDDVRLQEEVASEDTHQEQIGGRRLRRVPTLLELQKERKVS